jgi:hypothetical protein
VFAYVRGLAAAVAITLVAQTPTGAWTSGGFCQVDATNAPGLYRLDIPNAAVVTGASEVIVMWSGGGSLSDGKLIALVDYDPSVIDKAGYELSAAGNAAVVTEMDAASTQLAGIKAKTDNLPAAPAAVSDIPTATQNADALLDRVDAVETGLTARQAWRLILAAVQGKLSIVDNGDGTKTVTMRDLADTKNRISATVDANGQRTAVTRIAT